jgi:hypothetical protein
MAEMPQLIKPSNPKVWEDPSNPGHCMCIPDNAEVAELLAQKGLQGIRYINVEPVFAPVAEATVPIDGMSANRGRVGNPGKDRLFPLTTKFTQDDQRNAAFRSKAIMDYAYLRDDDRNTELGNFTRADIELAMRWSKEQKDGQCWSIQDVTDYREAHKLTWHECQDRKTMQLIPTAIHDYFRHTGGVAVQKYYDKLSAEAQAELEAMDSVIEDDIRNETARMAKARGVDPAGNAVPKAPKAAPAPARAGFCPLHLIITFALIAGTVVSFLTAERKLFWCLAYLTPYALILLACFRLGGLPDFLRGRFGAIVLLVVLVVTLILAPIIAAILFAITGILLLVLILRIVFSVPVSTVRVERTDASGRTTTETKTYFGDADTALRSAEDDLRREGYDDIRRN